MARGRKRKVTSISQSDSFNSKKFKTNTYVSPQELALYDLPPIDPTIKETYQVPYRPIATYVPGGDIKFKVKGDAEDFIKLSQMDLAYGVEILGPDGRAIQNFHRVGPINNSGHSFIDKVDISWNNQSVSSSNKYSQRSYISKTLNYGYDAMNSHLANALYVKDTAGQMDTLLTDNTIRNHGLQKRSESFVNGKKCYFHIHLDCDVFNIDRLLPNMVDIEITITPSKSEYCLMAGNQFIPPDLSDSNKKTLGALQTSIQNAREIVDHAQLALNADTENATKQKALEDAKKVHHKAETAYENQRKEWTGDTRQPPDFSFNIIDPILWVTKVKLLDSVFLGQQKALRETEAKFPITRVTTKNFSIPEGATTFSIDNAYTGQLPKRLMYVLIDMQAFSGLFSKNPLNYQHFDLIQTSILVNGKCVPLVAFKPNFSGGNVSREYQNMFNALGIYHNNAGLIISQEDFQKGYTFFIYDLTQNASASDSSHLSLQKQGDIRIDLQFKNPLRQATTVLVISEFDNLIEIDKDRNVFLDFNPV